MATHALTTPAASPRRMPLLTLGRVRRAELPTAGTIEPRRSVVTDLLALEGEQGVISTDTLRARLEELAQQAIDALDALDGDPDMEPDADGEEAHEGCCAAADDNPVSMPCRQPRNDFGSGTPEDAEDDPDEASRQPVTLAPDRTPAKVIHFPRRLRLLQVTA